MINQYTHVTQYNWICRALYLILFFFFTLILFINKMILSYSNISLVKNHKYLHFSQACYFTHETEPAKQQLDRIFCLDLRVMILDHHMLQNKFLNFIEILFYFIFLPPEKKYLLRNPYNTYWLNVNGLNEGVWFSVYMVPILHGCIYSDIGRVHCSDLVVDFIKPYILCSNIRKFDVYKVLFDHT